MLHCSLVMFDADLDIEEHSPSPKSLSELEGIIDLASAKYRHVTRAISPVQETLARHTSPSPSDCNYTTHVQEVGSSGSEASNDTGLTRAASFHQSFWGQEGRSSKSARVLGISDSGDDVDVVLKTEAWPSSKPSRLARVLERVSSRVTSFENAPGFS